MGELLRLVGYAIRIAARRQGPEQSYPGADGTLVVIKINIVRSTSYTYGSGPSASQPSGTELMLSPFPT
jgi:hypothetical protein